MRIDLNFQLLSTIPMLDRKRANDQLHTTALRLKQNRGQKLTESEEMKDLTQPQEKDKKHHRNSHF